MTGIDTASWISDHLVRIGHAGDAALRPDVRGPRSRAITATAPASSAMSACSAFVTSMITPPLSISARPVLTRMEPISSIDTIVVAAILPL